MYLDTIERVDTRGDLVANGAFIGGALLGILCAIVCGQVSTIRAACLW